MRFTRGSAAVAARASRYSRDAVWTVAPEVEIREILFLEVLSSDGTLRLCVRPKRFLRFEFGWDTETMCTAKKIFEVLSSDGTLRPCVRPKGREQSTINCKKGAEVTKTPPKEPF